MEPIELSWHTEGGRLAGGWVESKATKYRPAWMQSVSPREPSAQQCSSILSSPSSPFGKPRYDLEIAVMPDHAPEA